MNSSSSAKLKKSQRKLSRQPLDSPAKTWKTQWATRVKTRNQSRSQSEKRTTARLKIYEITPMLWTASIRRHLITVTPEYHRFLLTFLKRLLWNQPSTASMLRATVLVSQIVIKDLRGSGERIAGKSKF